MKPEAGDREPGCADLGELDSSKYYKTVLDEFYRVAFRKRLYGSIAELQADLDAWVRSYNEDRLHQGRWCFGRTPMQTFLDAVQLVLTPGSHGSRSTLSLRRRPFRKRGGRR